jgi:general secretion pathway protein D
VQPIIGQRVIESTIRLKDGETNFLAGLIRTDEVNTDTGIPGLSDIPVLGKLFSKNSSEVRRSDIMLTLTPHIIRAADITAQDLVPIWVGTESNMTFRGGSPRLESRSEGPFDEEPPADEEAEEEQRRLERLQRQQELEEEGGEPEQKPVEAPPVDLVPATPPVNPFEPPPEEGGKEEPPAAAELAAAGRPYELVRGGGAIGHGPGVRLAMQPAVVSVEAGERFQVDLEVDARVPVAHLPTTVVYDPARLEVERVVAGDYLGGSGAAEIAADTSTPGTIVLGASRIGRRPGVAGRGTVATIHFRTLAPGASPIRITDRRVLDPELLEIAGVETADAEIDVRAPLGAVAAP